MDCRRLQDEDIKTSKVLPPRRRIIRLSFQTLL